MKKLCDIVLALLIIAAIITTVLIIIKYGKNQVNEADIAVTLDEMKTKFEKAETEDIEIEEYYKGYKVEGIIEIPSINIRYPVLNKTNDASMKISITKFWGPGVNEVGNYTMAGHNNKDGTMFGKTKRLQIGDTIEMTDLKNNTVTYEIFKIYSIDPDDVSIVESVQDNCREITLITCTNGHKNRLIIKAREK